MGMACEKQTETETGRSERLEVKDPLGAQSQTFAGVLGTERPVGTTMKCSRALEAGHMCEVLYIHT